MERRHNLDAALGRHPRINGRPRTSAHLNDAGHLCRYGRRDGEVVLSGRGWEEILDNDPGASASRENELALSFRKCPYCAEEIRSAAIKCKHCGSMVEPIHEYPVHDNLSPENLSTLPENATKAEHINAVLKRYGAADMGDGYRWQGRDFACFADLVAAIKPQRSVPQPDPIAALLERPPGVSASAHMAFLKQKYNIESLGNQYRWQGCDFASFVEVLRSIAVADKAS